MSRIFISYKRVDKEKVFKIRNQIETALGEKCWIDVDGIESDAQFANVIINAINDCEVFLFMYSKAHTQIKDYAMDWNMRELRYAQELSKTTVLVQLDDMMSIDVHELKYVTRHFADVRNRLGICRLCEDIRKWLHIGDDMLLNSPETDTIIFNPRTEEFVAFDPDAMKDTTSVGNIPNIAFAGGSTSREVEFCTYAPCHNDNNNDNDTKKTMPFWRRLFKTRSTPETVYSSVFAPAEVAIGRHMLVQVYLHLQSETEKVKSLALEADHDAERRGHEPLGIQIKKGDYIEIELNVNSNTLLYNCRKTVIWQGTFVKRSFDFIVPSEIMIYDLDCSVTIYVNGAIAGEMLFLTTVVEFPRTLNTKVSAKPIKKLFISYSHKDIKFAEQIAKIHEALGIDVFFDKHRLKAGYIYSEEISRFIQTADTFVLCWSENAAQSEYVEKERKAALELAYPNCRPREDAQISIKPFNIQPYATPPKDMIEHYHFEEL